MLGGLGRGLIIGKLFGGGGEKQPKPSASETISSTMQALNPVQFG